MHTQHPLNLDNVGRFNSVLQERLRVLTKKIEDASFGEELAFLFKLTSEEHLTSEEDFKEVKEGKSYLAHPLWRDLQHLLQLKEEFSSEDESQPLAEIRGNATSANSFVCFSNQFTAITIPSENQSSKIRKRRVRKIVRIRNEKLPFFVMNLDLKSWKNAKNI